MLTFVGQCVIITSMKHPLTSIGSEAHHGCRAELPAATASHARTRRTLAERLGRHFYQLVDLAPFRYARTRDSSSAWASFAILTLRCSRMPRGAMRSSEYGSALPQSRHT